MKRRNCVGQNQNRWLRRRRRRHLKLRTRHPSQSRSSRQWRCCSLRAASSGDGCGGAKFLRNRLRRNRRQLSRRRRHRLMKRRNCAGRNRRRRSRSLRRPRLKFRKRHPDQSRPSRPRQDCSPCTPRVWGGCGGARFLRSRLQRNRRPLSRKRRHRLVKRRNCAGRNRRRWLRSLLHRRPHVKFRTRHPDQSRPSQPRRPRAPNGAGGSLVSAPVCHAVRCGSTTVSIRFSFDAGLTTRPLRSSKSC